MARLTFEDVRGDMQTRLSAVCARTYFQPPESLKLTYPVIIYRRQKIGSRHGNNKPYRMTYAFKVQVIDTDPESSIVDTISKWEKTNHTNSWSKDGLNYDTFTVYY